MTLSLFGQGRVAKIIHAKCEDVLPTIAANSIDSIVTDPPAAISFMGQAWDGDRGGRAAWVAYMTAIYLEALRVLKPGGHMLSWALPRTSHWNAWAIEDGGFEIRDIHHHLFGQGMPKSKAVLKPAVEHWILGRKPLNGTLVENIVGHGTGGLNIERCRIGESGGTKSPVGAKPNNLNAAYGKGMGGIKPDPDVVIGRWPANASLEHTRACTDLICVEGCPVRALDEMSGDLISGCRSDAPIAGIGYKGGGKGHVPVPVERSTGGASRFFYVAKPTNDEKTAGDQVENEHVTVKSEALMQWLVRLITPTGGTVLDMFAGSGTTGLACAAEGFSFIGIEMEGPSWRTAFKRLRLAYSTVEKSL